MTGAAPGALYRYWRQGQIGGRLALVLIAGTLPGVIGGSVIRVEPLPSPQVFNLVVAAVLIPPGTCIDSSPWTARSRRSGRLPVSPAVSLDSIERVLGHARWPNQALARG
jgi:hypothetical protein